MKKNLLFLTVSIVLFSCNPINKITFSKHQDFDENKNTQDLSVEFNGTASFYIKYKQSALLTDPFMSNPSMNKAAFGKIKSNTELLNTYNPKSKDVKIIAVGHAHYDHILDLPYFIDKLSSETILVGSENAIKQAKTLAPPFELIDVSGIKATVEKPGTWVYAKDNSMRVLAIKSAHLAHLFGIHLYEGSYEKDTLEYFPIKGKNFKQDETIAYLIDFLNENMKPEKRVYFSSSAVAYENGLIPKEIVNEKEIDLAILSIAKIQGAKGYPQSVVNYFKPKEVIFCHWENFFRDRSKKLKPIGVTNFKELIKDTDEVKKQTNAHFIRPGNSMVFVE